MELRQAIAKALAIASANSAEIALGIAVAGVPISMFLSGQARLKADDILAELEEDRWSQGIRDPMTVPEKAGATWKCYILPIISGGITIFCMIWSHKIQGRKLLALASAYTLTDSALRDLRNHIPDKKLKEYDHNINQEKVSEMSMLDGDIYSTNRGDVLCVDQYTGLKFFSNATSIKEAVSAVNAEMVGDIYQSLGYLYEQLGIPTQYIPKAGEELGWNVLADKQISVDFDSCLDKEGIPTLVMIYEPKPRPMFDML